MQEAVLETGPRASQAQYGSDLIVEVFARLGIPYIALNPGSSYRGIHDSLVNFDIPGVPQMVVCMHEEIAVAVAHGYAKMTGKPLLVGTHDVVGLQHAAMAIYNAWCDRVPMIVIGGTGPVASENRRPHIDWVHTALVQGNQVRDYVKWDDQPGSIGSIPDSILRAYRMAMTQPSAPVYLCFDLDLQEQAIPSPLTLPDPKRFAPAPPIAPDPTALEEVANALAGASFPVIMADAVGRHPEVLPALRELVELLQAPIVSMGRFNIASSHPLNVSNIKPQVLGEADVILGLDVFDLSGALGPGTSPERPDYQYVKPGTRVMHISLWELLQHSWASDFEILNPVDQPILADTRTAIPLLVQLVRAALERDTGARRRIEDRAAAVEKLKAQERERRAAAPRPAGDQLTIDRVSTELAAVVKEAGVPWCFGYGGGRGAGWEFTEPDQLAAAGRGSGLGQGTGNAIGAALALQGSGRVVINLVGDGEFMFTPSALWTASNLELPLLTIVNNNFSYGNDEGHQEHVAKQRGRDVNNKGVGIFIDKPKTNFAKIAEGFEVEGIGPIETQEQVRPALERAVDIIAREKRPVLIDVRTARGRGR